MRKPYIKPVIKKVEIDADILRMYTQQGFIELFWEELQSARKIDESISQEAVFDMLNDKWYRVFKSFRYSCYDSFRRRLNT